MSKNNPDGMILLEPGNRILAEMVKFALETGKDEEKKEYIPVDVQLCDFDDVSYHIVQEKGDPVMRVSMSMPCYQEIKDQGAEDALKAKFGDMVTAPENGYDVTVAVNFESLDRTGEDIMRDIAELKTTTLGGVFEKYFSALQKKEKSEDFSFKLRSDTSVYFAPAADGERVTVVFAIDFAEKVDRAIARVFLQEFQEARRHLGAAPPCQFGHTPPSEMERFGITEAINEDHLGFISFTLLPSHVSTKNDPQQLNKAVRATQMFRNFLQYHIKCSKSLFHSRMRARVLTLLKVLNRAKNIREEDTVKKNIFGKTFVRK